MNLLRRLFGPKKGDYQQPPKRDDSLPANSGPPVKLKIETDGLEQETQRTIWDHIGKTSDIPVFSGRVEHGYSHQFLSQTDLCPRCHGKTERKYSHFIYATDVETRVMFAPAGYFCTKCPTVIIDEEMISGGIKNGLEFRGVVGLDDPQQKVPNPFDTWNGKKPVYIFDEDEHILGLSTADSPHDHSIIPRHSTKSLMKARHKRRMAKKSRRKNRR